MADPAAHSPQHAQDAVPVPSLDILHSSEVAASSQPSNEQLGMDADMAQAVAADDAPMPPSSLEPEAAESAVAAADASSADASASHSSSVLASVSLDASAPPLNLDSQPALASAADGVSDSEPALSASAAADADAAAAAALASSAANAAEAARIAVERDRQETPSVVVHIPEEALEEEHKEDASALGPSAEAASGDPASALPLSLSPHSHQQQQHQQQPQVVHQVVDWSTPAPLPPGSHVINIDFDNIQRHPHPAAATGRGIVPVSHLHPDSGNKVVVHANTTNTTSSSSSSSASSCASKFLCCTSLTSHSPPNSPRASSPTNTTLTSYPTTSSSHPNNPSANANTPSPLRHVPLEVLSLMLSYCDAGSVVRFGRTSSVHNSLACKRDLWRALLARPWGGFDGHGGGNIDGVRADVDPKGYYAARRLFALGRRREKMVQFREARRAVSRNHRAWCTYLLTDFCVAPILVCLATVFLICLVVQLQRHEAVSWLTLWPLVAIGSLVSFILLLLCCTKYFDVGEAGNHCCLGLPGDFFERSQSVLKDFMEGVGEGESVRAHVSFCGMLVAFFVWVILVVLKVRGAGDEGGVGSWSWWQVSIPLWIVFGMTCCAPCFRWSNSYRMKFKPCVVGWLGLGVPMLAFFLLLNSMLEDPSVYGLSIAFIPLFLLDFIMLVWAGYMSYDDGTPAPMFAWFAGVGPLTTFKILLALYVDNVGGGVAGLSPAVVFIPLYITQAILLCGCVVVAFATGNESEIEWADDAQEPAHMGVPPV